jgi:hypothetical protein
MKNKNTTDWELVIINAPIHLYLHKSYLINLSLASKLIHAKLTPILYNTIKINKKFLSSQPNFFMSHIINFEYDDSLSNLWLIAKNWFNMDLSFKIAHIDPFIKEFNDKFKPRAIHCKSLYFEYLGNANYYLFPIACKFQNLRALYICDCVFSLEQFNNALENLVKLEILDLSDINIIKSPDSNSSNEVILPQNLHTLNYLFVRSCSTTLHLKMHFKFLEAEISTDTTPGQSLPPQLLPKLKKLDYVNGTLDNELVIFLDINFQIEDLRLPIIFLSYIISDKKFLSCLKKLKLYATDIVTVDVNEYNAAIPDLSNLERLSLYLNTNSQLNYAKLLIKNCPNLFALKVSTRDLKYYKLRELAKVSKNIMYFNDEIII